MSADHNSPHSPPALPEPQTPIWLTVLGGGLFFLAAMWWLTSIAAGQRSAANAAADGGAAVTAPAQPAAAR
jgi:hypothetical protein